MTQVPITDELAERVNYLFHHSLLSDSQIAIKIAEEDGLQSSANQVQEIRLLFGWHRQNLTPTQSTAQQQLTQQYVGQLIAGEGRSFGRRWVMTYLRRRGHRARQLEATSNNIMRHCYSTPAFPTGRSTNTVTAVQAWPTEMTALSLKVALRAVSLLWRHVCLHQRSNHSLTLMTYNQPTKVKARRCINSRSQRQSLALRGMTKVNMDPHWFARA